jgi:phosphoglycolate phosphatase-like HAD superfamily hydrolase
MTPDQLEALKRARARLTKAQRDLAATLADVFPVGSVVRWKRGRGVQSGVVTHSATSLYDSLCARNDATGKEIRFGSYEVIQASEGGDA